MSSVVDPSMRGYPRNRLTDRAAGVPVATLATRSRGYTIRYQDVGSGPAIVLLPGWTMSAADWRDAGYVDWLAATHRVLAVDPLGNGLSDKPHEIEAYGLPAMAADVVAVLDAAGVDRAVLWGYSFGTGIAVTAAARSPERTAGLILAAGGDLTPAHLASRTVLPSDAAMFAGDFEPLWDEFAFSEEDRAYDREVNDPVALGAMMIASIQSATPIAFERIRVPVLAYVGSDDDPDVSRATAAALGVEIHVLPGLNHVQTFSRLDLVMPLTGAFLEANDI